MKNFYLLLSSLIGVLILSPTESSAQWQADIRLTNDPAYSWTTDNNTWCIASSDSVVHVVWFDLRDNGNSEIYYKRSANAGESWGTDIRLTNNSEMSRFPSVAVSGSVVHVVWEESRDGNMEIYYKRSTDAGITWEEDKRLTNNSAVSAEASVTVSGLEVHVVWTDDRDGYNEIYFKCSTDGGNTWGTDTRLTNNTDFFSSWLSSVSASGSVVLVVFTGNRDGDSEIYYKRSIDGGLNWSVDTRLTNNAGFSESPSVKVSGPVAHVLWADSRDGNYEIYYKCSTDGGVSWGSDTRLTDAPDISVNSSVAISDSAVHVVWKDKRDGNWEIYYKRNRTGNVNGITTIRWQSLVDSWQTLRIYDIFGKEITTLVNEYKPAGNHETEFSGISLPGGCYFYQLNIGATLQTRKMILIK
jgi:hypothetical protein